MDDKPLRAALTQINAALAQAQANIEEARVHLDGLRVRRPPEPEPEPPGPRGADDHYQLNPDKTLLTLTRRWHGDSFEEVVRNYGAALSVSGPYGEPEDKRVPQGLRESWDGDFLQLPRTLHVGRFLGGPRATRLQRFEHVEAPPGPFVEGFGPCLSRIRLFDDVYPVNVESGPRYGAWWPISEEQGADGAFSKAVGAGGGSWVGPYPGLASALYYWTLHCRVMDRMTVERSRLEEYANEEGRIGAEAYDLQGRFNRSVSWQPNGKLCSTAPAHAQSAMAAWQSTVGNGGYDAQHYIRAFRAALALASYYPSLRWMVAPDVLAMARDCRYFLSDLPAVKDEWGPGEAVNDYVMVKSSLVYRDKGPQVVVRELAHPAHCIATAMWLGHREEFEPWARAMLDYMATMVMASGFSQVMPWDYGNPAPSKHGAKPGEECAADIEAPMLLHAAWALVTQLGEEPPVWLVEATAKVAQQYLRQWPEGEPPSFPKYWVTRKDGQELAVATPLPGGDNFNGWNILEHAVRHTGLARKIAARKGELESLWETHRLFRPWMAGLLGALA